MCDHASHNDPGHICGPSVGSSVVQTLDELEFERGLWGAARNGDLARVAELLAKRHNPNQEDNYGYVPLHYAARAGSHDVCAALIKGGANPNAKTRAGQATALHRAAYMGANPVVTLLARSGAELSAQDSDGATPLHKAVERNCVQTVMLLVSLGADVRLSDSKGRTPVDLASSSELCAALEGIQ